MPSIRILSKKCSWNQVQFENKDCILFSNRFQFPDHNDSCRVWLDIQRGATTSSPFADFSQRSGSVIEVNIETTQLDRKEVL